jgi:hypothetical protein
MWISLITTIGLRVPVAYGIAYFTRSDAFPNGRPESVFISLLTAWVLGSVINILFFAKGNWRKKALKEFSAESRETADCVQPVNNPTSITSETRTTRNLFINRGLLNYIHYPWIGDNVLCQ